MCNRRLWFFLLLCTAQFWSRSACAQPTLPRFSGEHLIQLGVAQTFPETEKIAKILSSTNKAEYFVIVAKSTGNGNLATSQFTNRVYESWQSSANFPDQNAVVIVLGIENRQLSVRAAPRLQSRYGLRGNAIDRELVVPHFIPYAKEQKFDAGLVSLLNEIDGWISERKKSATQQTARQKAQQEQIQKQAETISGEVAALLSQLETEFATRKKEGWNLSELEQSLTEARRISSQANERLSASPNAALNQFLQARQKLHSLQDQLQQFRILQEKTGTAITKFGPQLTELDTLLQKQELAGFAVGPSRTELEKAETALNQIRGLLETSPTTAWAKTESLEELLGTLNGNLNALPQQKKTLTELSGEVSNLFDEVEREYADASEIDAVTEELERRFQSSRQSLQEAKQLTTQDYPAALAAWNTLKQELGRQQTELETVTAKQRFWKRTFPLIVGIIVVAILLRIFLGMWWAHRREKRQALSALQELKDYAVDLNERLDQLVLRHQKLPMHNPDYTEPMVGATLSLYQTSQTQLAAHRDLWLEMMDAWTQAQKLIQNEKAFGTKNLTEVQNLVKKYTSPEARETMERECVLPLDQLEQAHEIAAEMLAETETALESLHQQLETIEAGGFSKQPYQPDINTANEELKLATRLQVTDPIGSQAQLRDSQETIEDVQTWATTVNERIIDLKVLLETREEVRQLTLTRRNTGFRFIEPGANPELFLDEISQQEQAIRHALNQGDTETAARHLTHSQSLIAEAKRVIEVQEKVRKSAPAEIQKRKEEWRRIESVVKQQSQTLKDLQREFLQTDWKQVEDVPRLAQQELTQIKPLISRVEEAVAPETQHYFRAQDLMKQIDLRFQEAERLTTLVEQCREQLHERRDATRSRIEDLTQKSEELQRKLRASTADRREANQRSHAISDALATLSRNATGVRIDWVTMNQKLTDLAGDLELAQQLFKQDLAAARQSELELEAAEQTLRQAESFYRSGFRAETSTARRMLATAREYHTAQNYEQVANAASNAQHAAREALEKAEGLAREKDRELVQQRQKHLQDMLQDFPWRSVVESVASTSARALAGKRKRRSSSKNRGSFFSDSPGGRSSGNSGSGTSTSSWSDSSDNSSSTSSTSW